MKTWFVLCMVCVLVLLCSSAIAAEKREKGPRVGARAPRFHTIDETGKKRTLADLSGENGLLVVFYRSAAW